MSEGKHRCEECRNLNDGRCSVAGPRPADAVVPRYCYVEGYFLRRADAPLTREARRG